MTITVIMPVYNSAAYILRTMNTIYSQTRLPDELVIVDDGSKDNTVELLRNYADEHTDKIANYKIISQENLGAGAARNRCLSEATCEWIAFLDSDDIWNERKLELVEQAAKEHPGASIIAHDEYAVNEKDLSDKTLCSLHERYRPEENLFLQLYRGNLFSTSCMTIRRDVIEKAGGFDESLRSAQDYDLWIRVGKYGTLYYMPEPLEIYVTREGNISANVYRRYQCEMKICWKYISELRAAAGEQEAARMIRHKVFFIHKVETWLAIKAHKWGDAARICARFPKEYLRGMCQ